jgi:hypothetical protein
MYAVSNQAYDRGYGPPDEIATLGKMPGKKSRRASKCRRNRNLAQSQGD